MHECGRMNKIHHSFIHWEHRKRKPPVSSFPTLRCLWPAPLSLSLRSSTHLSSVGCLVCRLSSVVVVVVVVRGIDASIAQNLQCMPTIELGRFSLLSFIRSFHSVLHGFFLLLCGIMRIRKGPRCVPLAPAPDRWCLVSKGFAPPGEGTNTRREDDEKQRNGGDNQVVAEASGGGAAASVAATSGCCHDNLDHHASSSAGTMERLEVDRVQRKRLTSTAAGYSRRRRARGPIAEGTGVISISSIIKAGLKSTKVELLSAESVITLVAKSPAKSPPTTDWTPAMKCTDQPSTTRLLQSLKRVCSAAQSTGLTAKEAVAKIQEQGLPGLIDGGERLIVQVAKSLRSSSAFVEREERGRYFIQEPSGLDEWDNFDSKGEEAKSTAMDFDTVIEAAKQLQKLQEPVKVDAKPGITTKPGTGRWTLALRGKSTTTTTVAEKVEPVSAPQKSNLSGPRCNRDDGKGWRCVRMAESGFSLCKYHRDQIRRAEIRRRKARNKSKKHQSSARPSSLLHRAAAKPSNPTSKEDVKAAAVPEAEKILVDSKAIDSDNELPDHKRRRFVKAKSLMSLL